MGSPPVQWLGEHDRWDVGICFCAFHLGFGSGAIVGGQVKGNEVIAQTRNMDDNATMDGIEPLGRRIKRERLDRGMTQRALAEEVGVGTPHISKIEAGRESPSDELLRKIAEVLGCDFDELLLAARRMPPDLMETLATDPRLSLEFLRQWRGRES